jgi:hypothetical protein
MKNIIFGSVGLVGVVAIIVAIACIGPFLFIWSINTLAGLGGSDFYISHGIWSYLVALVFLLCVRGSGG